MDKRHFKVSSIFNAQQFYEYVLSSPLAKKSSCFPLTTIIFTHKDQCVSSYYWFFNQEPLNSIFEFLKLRFNLHILI